jgi:hypothetical protein
MLLQRGCFLFSENNNDKVLRSLKIRCYSVLIRFVGSHQGPPISRRGARDFQDTDTVEAQGTTDCSKRRST